MREYMYTVKRRVGRSGYEVSASLGTVLVLEASSLHLNSVPKCCLTVLSRD